MYTIIKIIFTALVIVIISEIAKRSTLIAGIVASIPLTSLLAFMWLYFDTHDPNSIRDLSRNILLMIPPSLTLIVYVVTINESIVQLFMAGILPGLVLAGLFMLYVGVWATKKRPMGRL